MSDYYRQVRYGLINSRRFLGDLARNIEGRAEQHSGPEKAKTLKLAADLHKVIVYIDEWESLTESIMATLNARLRILADKLKATPKADPEKTLDADGEAALAEMEANLGVGTETVEEVLTPKADA